jgi:hypothetical protein
MLRAMLATGATEHEARSWAPWAKTRKLKALDAEINALPLYHWMPKRLGDLVELTDEEREADQLWLLRPCDVDWHVVQARVLERRRARNRANVRKSREEAKMANNLSADLDVRNESLWLRTGAEWTDAPCLMRKAAGTRAWRKPNGRPITGAALRVVVHRALDELQAQGLIESKTEPGRNGLPTRLVRRYAKQRGDTGFVTVTTVTAGNRMKWAQLPLQTLSPQKLTALSTQQPRRPRAIHPHRRRQPYHREVDFRGGGGRRGTARPQHRRQPNPR